MTRLSPFQVVLYCKGCQSPMGIWRVPAAHARTSRANVAAELIRRERDAAVCGRCHGLDRLARKAARREAIAAEAAAAAARRAERLTQDERALTVACPELGCGAAPHEECLWVAGVPMLASGATHARRLEAARRPTVRTPARGLLVQLGLFQ